MVEELVYYSVYGGGVGSLNYIWWRSRFINLSLVEELVY
jgi:hypothetical protein